MTRSIVVGVDESPGALAAAHYAAGIAQRRDVPLILLHVFESPVHGYKPLLLAGGFTLADQRLREVAEQALAQTVSVIESSHPGVKVDSRLESGGAAARLIDASAGALVTVLGSRGVGGFADLMLGSVCAHVATHGYGPIIVVRPAVKPEGPVLVGFDGSEAAYAAVEFGAREALGRSVPLIVASAYWDSALGMA